MAKTKVVTTIERGKGLEKKTTQVYVEGKPVGEPKVEESVRSYESIGAGGIRRTVYPTATGVTVQTPEGKVSTRPLTQREINQRISQNLGMSVDPRRLSKTEMDIALGLDTRESQRYKQNMKEKGIREKQAEQIQQARVVKKLDSERVAIEKSREYPSGTRMDLQPQAEMPEYIFYPIPEGSKAFHTLKEAPPPTTEQMTEYTYAKSQLKGGNKVVGAVSFVSLVVLGASKEVKQIVTKPVEYGKELITFPFKLVFTPRKTIGEIQESYLKSPPQFIGAVGAQALTLKVTGKVGKTVLRKTTGYTPEILYYEEVMARKALPETQYQQFKAGMKLGRSFRYTQPEVREINVNTEVIKKLSPEAKEVIRTEIERASKKKGAEVFGSSTVGTQLETFREAGDIDIGAFKGDTELFVKQLAGKLEGTGVKVEYSGHKLFISGEKAIEVHKGKPIYEELLPEGLKGETELRIEDFPYYESSVKTPSGIKVIRAREQYTRKVAGAFIGGREKDIQDMINMGEQLSEMTMEKAKKYPAFVGDVIFDTSNIKENLDILKGTKENKFVGSDKLKETPKFDGYKSYKSTTFEEYKPYQSTKYDVYEPYVKDNYPYSSYKQPTYKPYNTQIYSPYQAVTYKPYQSSETGTYKPYQSSAYNLIEPKKYSEYKYSGYTTKKVSPPYIEKPFEEPPIKKPPQFKIDDKDKEKKSVSKQFRKVEEKFSYVPNLLGIEFGTPIKEPKGTKVYRGTEIRPLTEKPLSLSPFNQPAIRSPFKEPKVQFISEIKKKKKKKKKSSGILKSITSRL